jgi:hypothetical protein
MEIWMELYFHQILTFMDRIALRIQKSIPFRYS